MASFLLTPYEYDHYLKFHSRFCTIKTVSLATQMEAYLLDKTQCYGWKRAGLELQKVITSTKSFNYNFFLSLFSMSDVA